MIDIDIYLSLLGTSLGLLITTLTFLTKFIKSIKLRKFALNILKITKEVMPFIEEAEKFIHFSGVEKKAYVMTKATQIVINNKMKIKEEDLSNTIDELVNLTNHVNINKRNLDLKQNKDLNLKQNQEIKPNDLILNTYTPKNELSKLYD